MALVLFYSAEIYSILFLGQRKIMHLGYRNLTMKKDPKHLLLMPQPFQMSTALQSAALLEQNSSGKENGKSTVTEI